MNLVTPLVLLCWLVCSAGWAGGRGASANGSAEQVWIGGKEYVRLNGWAKANEFEMRWLKRDEMLALANAQTRIVLQIHSPEAQINGVRVRLLFPLAPRQDAVYIAQLDLQQTFRPVLWPPRGQAGKSVKGICLDPGHGGRDPGFRIGGREEEKRYALLLAQELRDQLKRAGLKVSLTRSADTYVERATRPDLARQRKADLFISLHFNATDVSPGTVQGAEVYCLTPAGAPSTNSGGEAGGGGWFAGNRCNEQNMFLAYEVQKNLTRTAGMEDRGVHRARFEVLRDAVMPAVLIEAGFMSHPTEGRKILSAGYRHELAKGIVEGVLAYKRVVERGQ
jgi:N-acetylmuramoyl-L-alanine amidase